MLRREGAPRILFRKCECLVGGRKASRGLSWSRLGILSGCPGCLAGLIGLSFGPSGRVR